MRSPMIETASYIPKDEKKLYTDLQILKSAAGWYIGTLFNDPSGFVEPGSRDTDYFPNEDLAKIFLKKLEDGDEYYICQLRMSP